MWISACIEGLSILTEYRVSEKITYLSFNFLDPRVGDTFTVRITFKVIKVRIHLLGVLKETSLIFI